MVADDLLSAFADIRECCVRPTAEEQAAFLDAIDELARVLIAGYGIGPAKAI